MIAPKEERSTRLHDFPLSSFIAHRTELNGDALLDKVAHILGTVQPDERERYLHVLLCNSSQFPQNALSIMHNAVRLMSHSGCLLAQPQANGEKENRIVVMEPFCNFSTILHHLRVSLGKVDKEPLPQVHDIINSVMCF